MKTNYNMWRQTEDDLCNIIFRALHSFGGRAELKRIYLFEKWMVNYVSEGLKKTNKESSIDDGSLTRILTGGRICRTRIFDDFSCKYFPILENKLSSLSVVNPSKVIAIAIDEAEDWHIDFDEDEQDFFWDVAMNLKFFCRVYQQKEIDIDFLEEGLEF